MRILGYSFTLLATVISLTGCIYGDIDKRMRYFVTTEAKRYCEANHYSYCEIYVRFYRDFLDQINVGLFYSLELMLPSATNLNIDNKKAPNKWTIFMVI